MEKFFSPDSIALFGLSSKEKNVPKLILDNLIRWGYKGRIFGVHPRSDEEHVSGITIYKSAEDLPEIPDLGAALVPAKYVPDVVESCGKAGLKRLVVLSGGFNELGEKGEELALKTRKLANDYDLRFAGPNCLGMANTETGFCLPFVPLLSPGKGGGSLISQSGGLGIFQWNMMKNENLGIAKFASIGNKLDVDEIDILKYFGKDPQTKVIGMYLESIGDGKALIEAACDIDKPILIYKANRTSAGEIAAMSHTASLSNDDEVVDTAFEKAGIIRVKRFDEFISIAKAFEMPPMRGNRIMVMSPAGGFGVIMSDICEEEGFTLADPGAGVFEKLGKMGNAGIINFKNPLDLGDIYNMNYYGDIFHNILDSDSVDGAVYLSQWPDMPGNGNDIYTGMFNTDVSKEVLGAVKSSGKPVGVTLFGSRETIGKIKTRNNYPVFDSPEEMIHAMKKQSEFYLRKNKDRKKEKFNSDFFDQEFSDKWLENKEGEIGEKFYEFLDANKIRTPLNYFADSKEKAAEFAEKTGWPVVLKLVSPDALHKSDVGGVVLGLKDSPAVEDAYEQIKENLFKKNPEAAFKGVRVMETAGDGYDMFIGVKKDLSFGQVIYFGYGGIFIEVFKDVKSLICPCSKEEVMKKLKSLKSFKILSGARGEKSVDLSEYAGLIVKISHLVSNYENISELDLNPVRIIKKSSRAIVLDARVKLEKTL